MAKASAPVPAPAPIEIQGHAAGKSDGPLPGRVESWGDDGGVAEVGGPVEVVEMDGGLGEQNKAEQIMIALRGDGSTEEFTNSQTAKVENVGEKVAEAEAKVEKEAEAPATRKDLLKNIDSEKRARQLEAQLRAEQEKNKLFTTGSIEQVMAARGLSREQAMEAIVMGGVTPTVVDPNPEATALKAEVARLKAIADAAEDQAVAKVVADKLADVEVPLVKAAKRIPMPQADGTARYMSTHDVIAELAEQLWINEGKPSEADKPRQDYIAPAAKLLESALNEEYGGLIAAAKPTPAAKVKAEVPAVGKRGAPARATSSDEFAGMDDYTRRLAIAKRFGV